MRSWSRRMSLIAVGGILALWPLATDVHAANAANNEVDSQHSLTFVDTGGRTVTCTVINYTDHNTDDPNQPYVSVSTDESGNDPSCGVVDQTIEVDYKDKDGVSRSSAFSSSELGAAKVGGTYSAITTTVSVLYYECDSNMSATCTSSATSAPK